MDLDPNPSYGVSLRDKALFRCPSEIRIAWLAFVAGKGGTVEVYSRDKACEFYKEFECFIRDIDPAVRLAFSTYTHLPVYLGREEK